MRRVAGCVLALTLLASGCAQFGPTPRERLRRFFREAGKSLLDPVNYIPSIPDEYEHGHPHTHGPREPEHREDHDSDDGSQTTKGKADS